MAGRILKETLMAGLILLIIPFILYFSVQMFFASSVLLKTPLNTILIGLVPILGFVIPLTISIYFGKKRLYKKSEPKKILYKMPLATIIPSIVVAVIYEIIIAFTCYGEGCLAAIIWPIYSPVYIAVVAAVAFVFALFMLYLPKPKRIITYVLFFIAVVFLIVSLFSIGACDSLRNNRDFRCFSEKAIANNDVSVCLVSRLAHRCVANYAVEKNEPLACNELEQEVESIYCFSEVADRLNNESICDLSQQPDRCLLPRVVMPESGEVPAAIQG